MLDIDAAASETNGHSLREHHQLKSKERNILLDQYQTPYLYDSCPEMKAPNSTPMKNKEVVRGAFQSLLHTRSHCRKSKGMHHSFPEM